MVKNRDSTINTTRIKFAIGLLVFGIVMFALGASANEVQPPDPESDELMSSTGFESPSQTAAGAPFILLGQEIPAGERRQLNWEIEAAMGAVAIPTPILVAHGNKAGPVLCLTAAIHGDELNGVEVVRRIVFDLKPEDLSGTVIGIPIVNASGYLRGSRYLPDRRDLNRFFPGSSSGSLASRFAKSLFDTIIKRCSALVDMHTGSFQRINLPQLRADLTAPPVAEFSKQFGAIAVLHGAGPKGSLRRAATDVGIPAVTLEAGEASRFDVASVSKSVEAIQSLLNRLEMVPRFRLFGEPQPAFYESQWVRADSGGILFNQVALGEVVKAGQPLGTITDPIRNDQTVIAAPFSGRILGMAVNQVVMPGFAAYHVGRQASQAEAIADAMADPMDDEPQPAPRPSVDGQNPALPPVKTEDVEVLGDPMAPPEQSTEPEEPDEPVDPIDQTEPAIEVNEPQPMPDAQSTDPAAVKVQEVELPDSPIGPLADQNPPEVEAEMETNVGEAGLQQLPDSQNEPELAPESAELNLESESSSPQTPATVDDPDRTADPSSTDPSSTDPSSTDDI